MNVKEITFSFNDYDEDGYAWAKGIHIHIGPMRLTVGETLADLHAFIAKLQAIAHEIEHGEPPPEGDAR